MSNKSLTFKIVLSLILCLSILFTTTLSAPIKVSAKSTSQMKNEISDLEKKSQELEKKIATLKKQQASQKELKEALQNQITITEEKIAAATKFIDSYKAEIDKFEAEIAAKETEIAETKELYMQRVAAIYMSGNINSDLLVLLESDDLSDYLSLSEISKSISSHDKQLIDSLSSAISDINLKKSAINQKISEQNTVKKSLDESKEKLKKQRSEINSIISEIEQDKDALEEQNAQYEKAIEKLEDEIQAAIQAANNSGKNPVFTSGTFTWPVPGYYNITSYYGYRVHPISGKYKLHGGIDIASSGIAGKPIVAAADGVVIAAGYNTGGFGNWVMINHGISGGNQFVTVYAHMKYSPIVKNGQNVKAGKTLGYVGNTGNSKGNHLHFEVRINGNRTNPMNYFSKVK